MSETKKIPEITQKQISDRGVQALADRPNAQARYGVGGLSAPQLKLWFDKLAEYLAKKINEITTAISSEDAAYYIRLALDEANISNLGDLINAFGNGTFAKLVVKVYPQKESDTGYSLTEILDKVLINEADSLESITYNSDNKSLIVTRKGKAVSPSEISLAALIEGLATSTEVKNLEDKITEVDSRSAYDHIIDTYDKFVDMSGLSGSVVVDAEEIMSEISHKAMQENQSPQAYLNKEFTVPGDVSLIEFLGDIDIGSDDMEDYLFIVKGTQHTIIKSLRVSIGNRWKVVLSGFGGVEGCKLVATEDNASTDYLGMLMNCSHISNSTFDYADRHCKYIDASTCSGYIEGIKSGEAQVFTDDGRAISLPLATDIDVSLDQSNYKLSFRLLDSSGKPIGKSQVIDLPLESMVVGAEYDSQNKDLILTLKNGETVTVPLDDIIAGFPTNIENGSGEGAIQQKRPTDEASAFFELDADTNENAIKLDSELSNPIPFGATGDQASSFGSSAAIGEGSHSEGLYSISKGKLSHAEGNSSVALGTGTHAEGGHTVAGTGLTGIENGEHLDGRYAHAEGYTTVASGVASHAEGDKSKASARGAHAEGLSTEAKGKNSHAEGQESVAYGVDSHAEGRKTTAGEDDSKHSMHAEGAQTSATGTASHAEGAATKATADAAHAEGRYTTAGGDASHAEGAFTVANNQNSHAGGFRTQTSRENQTVIGEWNASGKDALFIVGNGGDESSRSNAFVVKKDGRAVVGALPKEPMDVATKSITDNLDERVSYLESFNLAYPEVRTNTGIIPVPTNEFIGKKAYVTSFGGMTYRINPHFTDGVNMIAYSEDFGKTVNENVLAYMAIAELKGLQTSAFSEFYKYVFRPNLTGASTPYIIIHFTNSASGTIRSATGNLYIVDSDTVVIMGDTGPFDIRMDKTATISSIQFSDDSYPAGDFAITVCPIMYAVNGEYDALEDYDPDYAAKYPERYYTILNDDGDALGYVYFNPEKDPSYEYSPPAFELVDTKATEIKVHGANLIKFPYQEIPSGAGTTTLGGVPFETLEDGSIIASGTSSSKFNFIFHSNLELPIGTYTFSITGTCKGMVPHIYESATNTVLAKLDNIANGVTSQTFTVDRPVTVSVYVNNNVAVNDIELNVKPMLNIGATALPYTPYKAPTTISIPEEIQALNGYGKGIKTTGWTITDFVDLENQLYNHRMETIVMDGVNNQFSTGTGVVNDFRYFTYTLGGIDAYGLYAVTCSHYVTEQASLHKDSAGFCYIAGLTGEQSIFVYLSDQTIKTPAAANEWLKKQYDNGTPLTFTWGRKEPIVTSLPVALDGLIEAESGGYIEVVTKAVDAVTGDVIEGVLGKGVPASATFVIPRE